MMDIQPGLPVYIVSPFQSGYRPVAAEQPPDDTSAAEESRESESSAEEKAAKEDSSQPNRQLSADQQSQVEQLKQRDREVRAHEQAHRSAGGSYIRSGIQFEFETGPDGKRYAVGGEVSIDTSKVPGDPRATMQKAQIIRQAALAPAEPSAQDQRVAAEATQMETTARSELLQESRQQGGRPSGPQAQRESAADSLYQQIRAIGSRDQVPLPGQPILDIMA
jgi:hypothetical protein